MDLLISTCRFPSLLVVALQGAFERGAARSDRKFRSRFGPTFPTTANESISSPTILSAYRALTLDMTLAPGFRKEQLYSTHTNNVPNMQDEGRSTMWALGPRL
ncbi:hypothetical protein DFH09DRAFT_53805 [Mycena vulgaris]|nr:hypothetical protein DFH09DRAFT_53805 [Mycena vulgaris]